MRGGRPARALGRKRGSQAPRASSLGLLPRASRVEERPFRPWIAAPEQAEQRSLLLLSGFARGLPVFHKGLLSACEHMRPLQSRPTVGCIFTEPNEKLKVKPKVQGTSDHFPLGLQIILSVRGNERMPQRVCTNTGGARPGGRPVCDERRTTVLEDQLKLLIPRIHPHRRMCVEPVPFLLLFSLPSKLRLSRLHFPPRIPHVFRPQEYRRLSRLRSCILQARARSHCLRAGRDRRSH